MNMEAFIQNITSFIERNEAWAPVIMGLVAFGESLFIVGLFIPATALFIAAGALAAAGTIETVPLVVSAIIGAVLGDIVSYVIGRRSGYRIVYSRWGRQHRSRAARARAFFRKYGAASVFLGRFLGPLRCTVPFMAGMMRMNVTRFQIANVASAILWAPAMLLPSFAAVKGLDILDFIGI